MKIKHLYCRQSIRSSSAPGLKAKPIIDIVLVVNDINKLDSFSNQFQDIDYEVIGEFGITRKFV
ncbi:MULTISPECIES: GrpB family protein [Bacillus]|uniref:GrpB family protein n=1 Tax=Bacillus TaxID=1386 RepID=UPI0005E24224|nr:MULTISPECIES: GrpB family protein [Bacillus cereus group]KIZ30404.1 hypothetical protein SK30_10565 [Bacillus cereus]